MSVCLSVRPKTLGQAGGLKNCSIWLKFGTLVPWVNTWGCFLHSLKILIHGAWDEFSPTGLKLILRGRLEASKVVSSDMPEI